MGAHMNQKEAVQDYFIPLVREGLAKYAIGRYTTAMMPHNRKSVHKDYEDLAKAQFGIHTDELRALKEKFDPKNLFSQNANLAKKKNDRISGVLHFQNRKDDDNFGLYGQASSNNY